jgi:FdrA protein
MVTAQRSIRNLYRDSVSLMQFSEKLRALPGVQQASAVMATENNISLLVEAGLLAGTVPPSPNDLLIVVEGSDEAELQSALGEAEALLKQRQAEPGDEHVAAMPARSIAMGVERLPGANFALISTPGEYAAAEALKALRHGLHVMMFSDNVSVEDEILLKEYSRAHDLLFMGPDCGTAIINGIPLGFANVVRRGPIGIVAASGTGLQQVSSLIDRLGGGVSQALGTGGHDLSARVGGITMIQGIAALAADPGTSVIVLVSKPPAPQVMAGVLAAAQASGKPVVVDFIGADPVALTGGNLTGVRTLEDAARAAVALAGGRPVSLPETPVSPALIEQARQAAGRLRAGQHYVRGLFSGGTFCFESLLLLGQQLGPVYSNIPLRPEQRLANVWHSQAHTAIDLGDDLFTQGRPHPMIDFRLRCERILQEASDPATAVILLDIVLGYSSHLDPAAELVPAMAAACQTAEQDGRQLVFVGSVCGTQGDPQPLDQQEQALRQAGMLLAESNAQAACLAAAIVQGVQG